MKTLIESCPVIDTKAIKKNIKRAKAHKTPVDGCINLSNGSVADYSIEYGSECDYLVIRHGVEEQRVKLTESELRYGSTMWFICDCERHVRKLYLPPRETQFKCRYCHNLVYELTRFNRKSMHGQLMYRTNRMIKLMKTRESIRSPLYDGKFTHRFERFLVLSDAAGFKGNRADANALLANINKWLVQSF